jgi:hypothetical protein
MDACMKDNQGHPVDVWLPRMQSDAFLRAAIAIGDRTAECWSELTARRQRVHAAMRAIHGVAWTPKITA